MSRTTWQPKMGQRWHRIDMNPVDSAAWLHGLRYYANQDSIAISKEPTIERIHFDNGTPSCSGIILGLGEPSWMEQVDWLLRFRQADPNCIVIGWGPKLHPPLLPLFLEAGVSLICSGYDQLLPCAKMAVKNGRLLPIENDPILTKVQMRLTIPRNGLIGKQQAPSA